jgi:hypothetical protein
MEEGTVTRPPRGRDARIQRTPELPTGLSFQVTHG